MPMKNQRIINANKRVYRFFRYREVEFRPKIRGLYSKERNVIQIPKNQIVWQ